MIRTDTDINGVNVFISENDTTKAIILDTVNVLIVARAFSEREYGEDSTRRIFKLIWEYLFDDTKEGSQAFVKAIDLIIERESQ